MKTLLKKMSVSRIIVFLCIVLFAVLVPNLTTNHMQKVFNVSLNNAILALALMIMLSMCGMLTFSFIPFMGVGAGIVAGLTTGQFGFTVENTVLALLIAMVVTGIFSLSGDRRPAPPACGGRGRPWTGTPSPCFEKRRKLQWKRNCAGC